MGRLYRVGAARVALSSQADLATYQAGSGRYAELVEISFTEVDSVLPTGFEVSIDVLRFIASGFAVGSGGSSMTPVPQDLGDSASQATAARVSDVSAATGTSAVVLSLGCHIYNGLIYRLPEPIPIQNSEALVLRLNTTPPTAITCSSQMLIRERGG